MASRGFGWVMCALLGLASTSASAQDASGLPWIAFARVIGANGASEAKLTDAVTRALLNSEANVVESADLAKAAARRGIARARWADVGALNDVATEIGADYVLFARVRGVELEMFTLSKGGALGATERVALGKRGAPPPMPELEAALGRLVRALPRAAGQSATGGTPPPAGGTAGGTSADPPASPGATVGAQGGGAPAAAAGAVSDSGGAPANAAADPSVSAAGGPSALTIALFVGAGVAGLGAGGAIGLGIVMGMDALSQSNALLTLPQESPEREKREEASLETALIADVAYGAAVVLVAGAVGLAVGALVVE